MDGRVIVVGASAGGMEAFLNLVSGLDAAIPAAICLVLHISGAAPAMFAKNLSRKGPFPAVFASDGEAIENGRIFIAPPDRHMIISKGSLRLVRTPRENWTRPAIDPLFRSAAAYCGSRTIGVLLSGLLDDGADGLRAIKRCGGITVVQDPADAAFPDMPRNAIARGHADHVTPLASMPQLLRDLATAAVPADPGVPDDLMREVQFIEQGGVFFHYPEREWDQSRLACPDCGGPLWQRKDESGPYGCSVGHRFGVLSLMSVQDKSIEQSLWAALRIFQERSHVLTRMAETETKKGNLKVASVYRERASESEQHSERLKEFLQQIPRSIELDAEGEETVD
jgi:two-component system, chemotaxis family, protein-glutamate methylesterase/glutaminase